MYGREPDPVFFCLLYKTHVKFFISSLFPSVSFTLPLPSLPLSLPFAAAPLSHLFTCLNSLLPGHIDVKVPFLAKVPKTTQNVSKLSLSNLDEEWSQTCAAHGGMGAIGDEDSCWSFAFAPWQAASLQNSVPSTSHMQKKDDSGEAQSARRNQ